YTTIAADVLARHMRQRGEEVFFLTGTDEHGEPVAQAAERLGLTPQELVDRNAPKFQELVKKVNATNDFFIRTSDPQHKQGVQDISLSRVRISWGVEVPWEPSQVFYVWFDALLNYYTALTYAPGASVEKFWPPNVQLLAKDILKFHAVIWPALLMAAELP